MRLFVAVNPPVEAIQELADAVAPLHELAGADRLRWSSPEGWHLTLAFLGEVAEPDVPVVADAVAAALPGHGVHRLRLAGGGCFGDRVLWAGVEGETWALRRLAHSVRDAVEDAGIDSDQHGFNPHLTVARAGSSHGLRRAAQRLAAGEMRAMAAVLQEFRGGEWAAGEVHLMHSEPGHGPYRYRSLQAWPLTV